MKSKFDSKNTFYQLNFKEGLPIIFIHGVGLDHTMWAPQINAFDNSVITYDILGHGKTSLKKENILITSVTSYDASFAKLADDCGVDIILVGDSLGEVIKGAKNTHSVTVDDICYHTKSVSKGIKYAYLISDMPKHSFRTKRQALSNAIKKISKDTLVIAKY